MLHAENHPAQSNLRRVLPLPVGGDACAEYPEAAVDAERTGIHSGVRSTAGSTNGDFGSFTFQCASASVDTGLGLGHSHGPGHSHGLGRLVSRSFVDSGLGPPFLVHFLVPDGTRGVERSLSVTTLNQWYKFHHVVCGTGDAAESLSATPRPLLLFDVRSFSLLIPKFML
ncbi:hypothetical protein BV25DRAFT_1824004 [Artomyces pyxidatus]|uniref:Uncharacterized protein n=1 Tax=Artomyces pyxidatus TaxID=48021 RepID=A0ACB8T724_9AGAM|nr:hypothetical protein BV25DRAFT_1824004 [Artomyces pyxidatus]